MTRRLDYFRTDPTDPPIVPKYAGVRAFIAACLLLAIAGASSAWSWYRYPWTHALDFWQAIAALLAGLVLYIYSRTRARRCLGFVNCNTMFAFWAMRLTSLWWVWLIWLLLYLRFLEVNVW